jgi:hypothetical protein
MCRGPSSLTCTLQPHGSEQWPSACDGVTLTALLFHISLVVVTTAHGDWVSLPAGQQRCPPRPRSRAPYRGAAMSSYSLRPTGAKSCRTGSSIHARARTFGMGDPRVPRLDVGFLCRSCQNVWQRMNIALVALSAESRFRVTRRHGDEVLFETTGDFVYEACAVIRAAVCCPSMPCQPMQMASS